MGALRRSNPEAARELEPAESSDLVTPPPRSRGRSFLPPIFNRAYGRRERAIATYVLIAAAILFPLVDGNEGDIDAGANALAFALLALGLSVVVGFAGLLDLGYAAFFAIGAYSYGIFSSYQVQPEWSTFWEPFAALGFGEIVPIVGAQHPLPDERRAGPERRRLAAPVRVQFRHQVDAVLLARPGARRAADLRVAPAQEFACRSGVAGDPRG